MSLKGHKTFQRNTEKSQLRRQRDVLIGDKTKKRWYPIKIHKILRKIIP